MGSLFDTSFRKVARAALAGSGAPGYFKVQGYPGYPVIISRFEYGASEKVQVVEAFKEYIHLYAFGRAASQVQIQGHCLNVGDDFSGSAPTLKSAYQNQLRAFKAAQGGGLISIVGPVGVLKGVANSLAFNISSGQDSIINFGMSFIVLDGTSESSIGASQGSGGGSSNSTSSNTSTSTNSTQTAESLGDTAGPQGVAGGSDGAETRASNDASSNTSGGVDSGAGSGGGNEQANMGTGEAYVSSSGDAQSAGPSL